MGISRVRRGLMRVSNSLLSMSGRNIRRRMRRSGFRVRCREVGVRRRRLSGLGSGRSLGSRVSRRSLSRLRLYVCVLGMHSRRRYGFAFGNCRTDPLTSGEMFAVLMLVKRMLFVMLVLTSSIVLTSVTRRMLTGKRIRPPENIAEQIPSSTMLVLVLHLLVVLAHLSFVLVLVLVSVTTVML
jgi:hypothetical protein